MSGTNPLRLGASLRPLGGKRKHSESHLPDFSTDPEQLEGEHTVRFVTSAVLLCSLSAFQRSQTPSPQPKRRIKDKFKELFTSKSKSTSQTHALPVENIRPTEVCLGCIFEASPITNLTRPTPLPTLSLSSM